MFASSQYPLPAHLPAERPVTASAEGEGHDCEAARLATQSLLWPQGRPGAWLLLLAGTCLLVVIEAVRLQFT